MDANFPAINESQWILCLLQITCLMSISWVVGRIALHRFPDISASSGVVALTVSAGLILVTWAGVPRPFELISSANDEVAISVNVESSHPSHESLDSTVESEHFTASWLSSLAAQFNWTLTPNQNASHSAAAQGTWRPVRILTLLLMLTLSGGLVGVFRVMLSSKTIHTLAKSSLPVEDTQTRAEVIRILSLLPNARQHKHISVRQFKGLGSPFVSWLTGDTIFVPESFLTWSDSEQSISLAHEVGHLQRRDHYCRLITQLTFCLTWLHPLAWLLHRQTVLAQELAADQVAAQATENPSAYCRGLSRLALRFDAECRQPSLLGVSVSSSLIRRITMLKGMNFYRQPCSRFVNRCITLSAFIACTWIGCWSVSGQDSTQEKPTDSKVVPASHTAPVKMFSAAATAPWEVIGDQPGYVKVQLSRLLNHPDFKSFRWLLTSALNSALRSQPDVTLSAKEFGLALDEISHIQGGVLVHFNYNVQGPEGHRGSIGFGMSKAELTTDNPVDWPGLIKAFDFEKLRKYIAADPRTNGPDDLEPVREAWMKSAKKSRSHLFDTDLLWKQFVIANALGEKPSQTMGKQYVEMGNPSQTKKAVWEAVSGGVATVVYDLGQFEALPEDFQDQHTLHQANLKMTLATEAAAWGVDFSQDYKTCQIRFAAVPKDGSSTDDLLKHFEAIRAAVEEEFREALEQDPDNDDVPVHPLRQLKKAKVTIVKSKKSSDETTKAYLLVEGECSADLAPFLNTFSAE